MYVYLRVFVSLCIFARVVLFACVFSEGKRGGGKIIRLLTIIELYKTASPRGSHLVDICHWTSGIQGKLGRCFHILASPTRFRLTNIEAVGSFLCSVIMINRMYVF